MNFPKHLQWIGIITVLINAIAMFSPIINSGDAVIYAAIAKQIVLSHDWIRLVLDGHDWLDKPHLPFWITALFFRIWGISPLTYILPGFIFHLIGGYYTYRLARILYNKQSAVLAVLIYLSVFNLMDSAIEIKAEAYLIGQIMAACYYWLRYDAQFHIKYLVLGAIFTAMAIMTKGIFVLVTITSGLVCLWSYQKQLSKLFSIKWLVALILSLLFIAPELVALHLQFDQYKGSGGLQNEGSVFKFFFWDSQFGRFFNTGPIQNHNGFPFYFVMVFLWGFLPWTIVFFAAIFTYFKEFDKANSSDRTAFIFLSCMFLCSFLMFSATKYQMGYYIDIILPFAAILCANFINNAGINWPLFVAQMGLVFFLFFITIVLSIYVMNFTLLMMLIGVLFVLFYYFYATRTASLNFRAITYSVLAIDLVYIFLIVLTYLAFSQFSVAYNAIKLFGKQSDIPIYVYRMPEAARELSLYSKASCHDIDTIESLNQINGNFYLLVKHDEALQFYRESVDFRQIADMRLVVHKTGTFDKLLQLAKGTWPLESIDFLEYAAR